jgi:dihydroorotate dehydrogenase
MFYEIFSKFLEHTDPEFAHSLAIKFLKNDQIPLQYFASKPDPILKNNIFNIDFNGPIGLAAGFDKNAEIFHSAFKLGFNFVEVGTITPKPQEGNLKPRVFRFPNEKCIINRLGFPNDGMDLIHQRILEKPSKGILGINIGPNKENSTKIDDYLLCLEKFHELASYITINISSPNTPNLRSFHDVSKISELIDAINIKRKELSSTKPILYKISPDVEDLDIEKLSEVFLQKKIDGLILTNTTLSKKEHLTGASKNEDGGLSGTLLYDVSNKVIKSFYKFVKKNIPIIGVGGVSDADTALEKIKSGASLLQLYTSLVFRGPYVASDINEKLAYLLKEQGYRSILEAIGSDNK